MRTMTLRFLAPWLVALAIGCGSSSSTAPTEPTTPPPSTAAASSGGAAPAVTPAPAETTPATAPATPDTTPTPTTTAAADTTPPAAATAPATAPAAATTPVVADAATIARGRRAAERACGSCHEPNDAEGPSPNKNWTEEHMRAQIRQGAGRMRAIPVARLNDADLNAMIAFFRSTHAVR